MDPVRVMCTHGRDQYGYMCQDQTQFIELYPLFIMTHKS